MHVYKWKQTRNVKYPLDLKLLKLRLRMKRGDDDF